MPRHARHAPGGLVYHVLNRAAGRVELFRRDGDYAAFVGALAETIDRVPGMGVCGYCLMPNHWHLVLWPAADGELARFMHRLTITHVRRWVEHRRRVGMGSVYQGRYKSFPVQDDPHFTTMLRYVERNPVRAGLARAAQTGRGPARRPRRRRRPRGPRTPRRSTSPAGPCPGGRTGSDG